MARGSHRASFGARLLYWRAGVNAGGENGHEENRSRREALQARRRPRGPRRRRGNRAGREGGEGLRSPEGAHGTLPWRRIRRGLPAESQDRGRGDGEDARGSDRGDRQGGAHRKDRRRKDLREHSGAGGAYPDGRNQRGGRLAAASEVGSSGGSREEACSTCLNPTLSTAPAAHRFHLDFSGPRRRRGLRLAAPTTAVLSPSTPALVRASADPFHGSRGRSAVRA